MGSGPLIAPYLKIRDFIARNMWLNKDCPLLCASTDDERHTLQLHSGRASTPQGELATTRFTFLRQGE